jgi:hypothetical protein
MSPHRHLVTIADKEAASVSADGLFRCQVDV